ncbi:MAG TPA: peptidoglycan bridge formation glycyltransferase FemA/FemB family protein, partial [Anaerolineales bacterium]
MSQVSLAEWNRFLQSHPNAHVLQTGEWAELKSAFGWKAIRVVHGNLGAQILFRKLPFGFTIAYIPKFLFGIQHSASSEEFWKEIDDVCKKHHAIFLKIEPDLWDQDFNLQLSTFNLSQYNIQPPRTIIVDIRGSESEILARMKQKCRYNIHLAAKKGVTVRAWDDLDSFHRMMLVTGGRDKF